MNPASTAVQLFEERSMTLGSLRTTDRFLCRATRLGKACVLVAGLAGCFAAAAAPAAKAPPLPHYAVIHHFRHGEGASPSSGLVQDKHGNLYGVNSSSSQGDWHTWFQRGCGLIYRITPDGTESTVFDFSNQNATRGCFLGGVSLLLEDGALYGGAGGGKYGFGVIWRLNFNGHYQVLHHFGLDEVWGTSGLIRGADGALYGTSETGGQNRGPNGETYGGVFRLGTDGKFTVLYNFRQGDPLGVRPHHGLTMGPDGLLYGTADDGAGSGTVFRVEASGQLSLIHTFHYNEGLWVSGLSLGQDGKLYGSAYEGGDFGMGTVWRVSTEGQFELLHSFNGHDGYGPNTPPVQAPDGTWYGTTLGNASLPFVANSTLYRVRFDGREPTVLHRFAKKENDGRGPVGRLLTGKDGGIYGATSGTVTDRYRGLGTGTVYRHAP
jgi:uncharacterized repeat protein (TIGR03803 family)